MDRSFSRARKAFAVAAALLLTAGAVTTGAATARAAAAPRTFTCADGSAALYRVPAGVTSVRVHAEGGGAGGTVTATVLVSPGQELGVVVGCAGGPGHHWGGDGGPSRDGSCAAGAPGAGSSAVLSGDLDETIVEAGGSGGAGGDCAGGTGGAGGNGSRRGDDGSAGSAGSAGPGTQPAAGGRGGVRAAGHGNNGATGRGRTGAGGGGGGGGCRGGAGGAGGLDQAAGGGGGGSSCAGGRALRPVFEAGGTGAGRVVISPDLLVATNGGSDVVDANGNGRQDIGDHVDYAVTVRNDGAVAVSGVTVVTQVRQNGPRLTLSCDRGLPAALSPGAAFTCSARHVLTAADVTARTFTVDSTATARSDSGETLTAGASRTTRLNPVPGMTLTNVATVADRNGNGLTDAGDAIDYAFVATNTGGGTLTNVLVELRFGGGTASCRGAALITGESVDCTGRHVITAAEVDARTGFVRAVASAGGTAPQGQAVAAPQSVVDTPLHRVAALSVAATVTSVADVDGNGRRDSGDVVHYSVVVTNAGTLTVTDVVAALPGVALTCAPGAALAAGATTSCTGEHRITRADADLGAVTHTAAATGRADGHDVAAAPVAVTTAIPVVATLAATGSATVVDVNDNELTDAGDVVHHSVLVTNEGTVTLTGLTTAPGTVTCPAAPLAEGGTTTCTGAYAITQDDVDRNTPVTHRVVVSGTTPAGAPVSAPAAVLTTETSRVVALTAANRVVSVADGNDNDLTDTGDVLTYEVVATNAGTVTLRSVRVSETAPDGTPVALDCGEADLAPAGAVTCRGTYAVTQADVDRGAVGHLATATGLTPWGAAVDAEQSRVRTELDRVAALTVTNDVVAADADGDGLVDAGDVLTYTAVATNAGTVTLSGVRVLEQSEDGPGDVALDCGPRSLAAGVAVTCTGTHVLTQDDVDRGAVTHSATALGLTPGGVAVVAERVARTTTPAQRATLAVTNAVGAADDALTYAVTVTNTGTLTLTEVAVAEEGTAPAGDVDLDCASAALAPGQALTCTGTYPVTQGDLDRGSVMHTAVASGRTPSGVRVDATPAPATTALARAAGLATSITAAVADVDHDGRADAGDVITYTIAITNTGGVTLSNVVPGLALRDRASTAVVCPTAVLAPAATTTCTSSYAITPGDEVAGSVVATTTSTATTPSGGRVTSTAATVTTEVRGALAPTRPQASVPDGLAATGVTAVTEMVVAGLVVLALGIGLLLFARRRRRG
jgi:uncharacterized repeat protein (TIGR01451 family)/LPXTG-motif cell wall-anchored protein